MRRILIDTNVVIDFALKRDPFFNYAVEIFKILSKKEVLGFLTATTITDIYYLLSKSKTSIDAKKFIIKLLDIVEIIDVGKQIVYNALNSDFVDFEDAVQNFSAKENDIDIIVTRNTKDFSLSTLSVMSPEEFLSKFN